MKEYTVHVLTMETNDGTKLYTPGVKCSGGYKFLILDDLSGRRSMRFHYEPKDAIPGNLITYKSKWIATRVASRFCRKYNNDYDKTVSRVLY